MRQMDRAAMLDEELHDLKLWFELLEGDRKAYYETSQWAIRQNKEEIGKLKNKNKELRDSIGKLKKFDADSQGGKQSLDELEKFDLKVLDMHKKYDDLAAEAKRREDKVAQLTDQLNILRKEAELVKATLADSPQAKEIRQLENRLDKAMVKFNEAQSVRKIYEQIIKKLQDERLTFDGQLQQFERTLKSKKEDAKQLESMSRDANHAKELAKAELTKIETQIQEERKAREKTLIARRDLVKQRQQELQDKLDKKAFQVETTEVNTNSEANKDQFDEVKAKKMAEFEEHFRIIKEATGVSDIQEVISKFNAQADTHNQLKQLQKQNEQRIEELKHKKQTILAEFEELKYSGESKNAHSRLLFEELKDHLDTAATRCSEAKSKFERVSKLLVNAKAGIQHLAEKLESVPLNGEKTGKVPMSDENVGKILDTCVQKLDALSNNIQGKELLIEQIQLANIAAQTQGEAITPYGVAPTMLPQFNCRVKLRPVEFEETGNDDGADNDDDNNEVLDRETIKKHAAQMLNARMKNKQAKKPKKKKSKDDSDDE